MNDFLNQYAKTEKSKTDATTGAEIVAIIEKRKIKITHRRIKRATRTFLYHITDWISLETVNALKKTVQRKLGCSAQVVTDEEGTALTFNGNHVIDIQKIVIEHSKGELNNECFAT